MAKIKTLKGTLSISRVSSSNICNVRIRDENSHENFVECELKISDMAEALFGLANRPVKMRVQGLNHVGKFKETVASQVTLSKRQLKQYGLSDIDRDKMSAWVKKELKKPGWLISAELNSQSSIEYVAGKDSITLNFWYYRYVDEEPK